MSIDIRLSSSLVFAFLQLIMSLVEYIELEEFNKVRNFELNQTTLSISKANTWKLGIPYRRRRPDHLLVRPYGLRHPECSRPRYESALEQSTDPFHQRTLVTLNGELALSPMGSAAPRSAQKTFRNLFVGLPGELRLAIYGYLLEVELCEEEDDPEEMYDGYEGFGRPKDGRNFGIKQGELVVDARGQLDKMKLREWLPELWSVLHLFDFLTADNEIANEMRNFLFAANPVAIDVRGMKNFVATGAFASVKCLRIITTAWDMETASWNREISSMKKNLRYQMGVLDCGWDALREVRFLVHFWSCGMSQRQLWRYECQKIRAWEREWNRRCRAHNRLAKGAAGSNRQAEEWIKWEVLSKYLLDLHGNGLLKSVAVRNLDLSHIDYRFEKQIRDLSSVLCDRTLILSDCDELSCGLICIHGPNEGYYVGPRWTDDGPDFSIMEGVMIGEEQEFLWSTAAEVKIQLGDVTGWEIRTKDLTDWMWSAVADEFIDIRGKGRIAGTMHRDLDSYVDQRVLVRALRKQLKKNGERRRKATPKRTGD